MANKITILYETLKHPASPRVPEVAEQLEKLGWQVQSLDLSAVNFAKRFWLRLWDGIWLDLVTSQFLNSLSENVTNWFRKQLVRPRVSLVLENLRKFQPPIILVTTFTGALVMSYLKSRQLYRGKVAFLLEGYSLNPLWVLKDIDLYLCHSERQSELLKQRQVDSSKYAVLKPDLSKDFFVTQNKEEAASELGLLTTMPTILLMTDEDGADVLRESFLKMIRSSTSFQVIVICRENSEIKLKLEKITSPVRHPVKFVVNHDHLPMLFAAASVIIGPLNQTELSSAAATKTPIIITDPQLLIQPENLRYLLEQNVVTLGRIPAEVVFLIESILEGRKITNLNAAYDILAVPKNSLLLADALTSIYPTGSGLQIKDYRNAQ